MLSTLAIVQLPSKENNHCAGPHFRMMARRNFGGKSLLEWVVRRVTDSQQLDGVIAVIEDDPDRSRLLDLVPPDVPVFESAKSDPLGRLAEAVREYQPDAIVLVSIDSPFVDPALIDRLIITAGSGKKCDYISYAGEDGRLAVQSSVGLFAEWCRSKAIRLADRRARNPAERRTATGYLYRHPESFRLRFIPIPAQLDRADVRLTIHDEEDWEHAQTIYEALGPESLDWQRIAGLLDQQPALRKRMAVLNRADAGV